MLIFISLFFKKLCLNEERVFYNFIGQIKYLQTQNNERLIIKWNFSYKSL